MGTDSPQRNRKREETIFFSFTQLLLSHTNIKTYIGKFKYEIIALVFLIALHVTTYCYSIRNIYHWVFVGMLTAVYLLIEC